MSNLFMTISWFELTTKTNQQMVIRVLRQYTNETSYFYTITLTILTQ